MNKITAVFSGFTKLSLAFLSVSILLSTGCNNVTTSNPKIIEAFTVSQNSHLNETGNVVSGDNYVFTYSRNEDPIPDATDDGAKYIVVFEIDKNNINNFTFENDNLAKINAMSAKLCFCPPEITNFQKLTKGSITGQKLSDNNWKVDGKLDSTYSFSGNFSLKTN